MTDDSIDTIADLSAALAGRYAIEVEIGAGGGAAAAPSYHADVRLRGRRWRSLFRDALDRRGVAPAAYTADGKADQGGVNHDADAFFASLEASYESRDFWMVQLRTEPVYDPFRADPRLEEMARRVGIPGGPD